MAGEIGVVSESVSLSLSFFFVMRTCSWHGIHVNESCHMHESCHVNESCHIVEGEIWVVSESGVILSAF